MPSTARQSRGDSPSLLEEGVELFAGVNGLPATLFHQCDVGAGFEIVAVVAAVLGGNPLGLGLAALVVHGRIKEAAVLATVQVGFAFRACISFQDLLPDQHLDAPSTMKTGKGHIRHAVILA